MLSFDKRIPTMNPFVNTLIWNMETGDMVKVVSDWRTPTRAEMKSKAFDRPCIIETVMGRLGANQFTSIARLVWLLSEYKEFRGKYFVGLKVLEDVDGLPVFGVEMIEGVIDGGAVNALEKALKEFESDNF